MRSYSTLIGQLALDGFGNDRTNRARFPFSAWALACLFLIVPALPAKATTPTEVYQAVSDVTAEIRLLHEANFTSPDDTASSIKPENRRPRHVLQLARTVLRKANQLASINGGSTAPVPAFPTREVTPGDVLAVVKSTAGVVKGLKPIFNVAQAAKPKAAAGKKTPSDVYAALYQLSEMVDGLGIPATVPNDVHQIAETILVGATAIARHYEVRAPSRGTPSAGKSPKDVYERAFALVGALDNLIAKRPELAPKGGLTVPYRHSGAIKPAHVLYALNDLLAEVESMKVALNEKSGLKLAPLVSGMTPSAVYDRLNEAHAMIEAMTKDA